MQNESDPIILPKEENYFETVRYVSPSLRHEITWLVLLSIIVLSGVAAWCFGWWLPAMILVFGGGVPAAAIIHRIVAERAMARRMRERARQK